MELPWLRMDDKEKRSFMSVPAHRLSAFVLSLLFSLIIVSCQLPVENARDQSNSPKVQGNTNGNIRETGCIVKYDGWWYYSFYGPLYKAREIGVDGIRLTETLCSQINIVGGQIFYTTGAPGIVCRMDLDGRNKKKLTRERVGNLIVVGETVFYRLSTDDDRWGQLYKTDTTGSSHIFLAQKAVQFAISDESIYYSNLSDGCSLYKMDFNGQSVEKLNDADTISINAFSDYVYYSVFLEDYLIGNPYRMRTDGAEVLLLTEQRCSKLNVYDGYIYFRNETENGRVFRMRTDGSDISQLSTATNCVYINVLEDTIMYYSVADHAHYKSSLDGSNIEMLKK